MRYKSKYIVASKLDKCHTQSQKSQTWNCVAGTFTIYIKATYFSVRSSTYVWADESSGDSYACKFTYQGTEWSDYKGYGSIKIGGLEYSRSGEHWWTDLYVTLSTSISAPTIWGTNDNCHTMKIIDGGTGPVNGKTYKTDIIWD